MKTKMTIDENSTKETKVKSTALITLPKTALVKVTKPSVMKRLPNMEELAEGDGVVDRIWEMYQKQLKRVHEMMILCDVQQQEIEALKLNQKLIDENVETKPKEEKERKLAPITYDKLNVLTKHLKLIFEGKIARTAHANALVHMLYTLYQLKGQASPDQLFASADVTEISGFRYASFLKTARMINYSPTTKKGLYVLTEVGKHFVQGKLTTKSKYEELTGLEHIAVNDEISSGLSH